MVASDVLAPPLTGPATDSDWLLVRPKPAAVKLPSVPILLPDPLSVVLPTEWPVKVVAVSLPDAVWLMVPPDASVTRPPLTSCANARLPAESRLTAPALNTELTVRIPDVVVRLTPPLGLVICSGPLTDRPAALTRLKSDALKLPSVPTRLAPPRVVVPVDWPVSVPAVMTPALWLMSPPAASDTAEVRGVYPSPSTKNWVNPTPESGMPQRDSSVATT